MTTRTKIAKTILAAAVIAAVVIPGAAAGSSTGTPITIPPWLANFQEPGSTGWVPQPTVTIPPWLANFQEPGSTGWVPQRSTAHQARTVDPLAVGYLIGKGLSPSEVTSWTTGACSHKVKARSCYAMLQRTVAPPKVDLVKLFLSRQDQRRQPERGGSNTAATAAVQGYMSYLGPHPAMTTDTAPVISGPYPVSGGTGFVQTVTWPESMGAAPGSSASPRLVDSYFPTPQDLAQVGGSYTIGGAQTQDAGRPPWIMSLTPADLAANAFGTGYALPSAHKGPSVESVLASMSPQTREYTKRIMTLTFAQLAAGAAGQP